MRAKAACPGCGQHRRLLPYVGQAQPVCAPCASAPPGPVCGQCGNEDWLYHKDRCARCVLTDRLTDLLGDANNRVRLGLQPLFDTLAHAEHPETVIGWMRPSASGTAHQLLVQLGRGEISLSHEALDALNTPGNGGTANHLDAVLTAIGALPPRDVELARLERAIPAALAKVADEERRKILRGYASWVLIRRARAASGTSPLTAGARHHALNRLAAATHLLDWLAGYGLDLATCQQAVFDDYQIEHRTRALHLADTYRGIERAQLVVVNIRDHTEKDKGEALLAEVARLRKDDAVFTDVMGPRGNRVPITAVVANLAQPTDPGTKKALARIRRVIRAEL
jgi:hypothetical protein